MRRAEEGVLMLTCALGQDVVPLSASEYDYLAKTVSKYVPDAPAQELTAHFLEQFGYPRAEAERIVGLLQREEALYRYLAGTDAVAVTRISEHYPPRLRRLKSHCPLVLFCKGDIRLLNTPCVSLVGARNLPGRNRRFAEHVGTLAAREGYTLVSGGAVGADSAAQEACLAAGGRVICFVPDALKRYQTRENVLFCSDEGWEFAFSSARALRRNRFIHALGEKTFVARCTLPRGGTWSGTIYNLQHRLSEVYQPEDNTEGAIALGAMGAVCVEENFASIAELMPRQLSIFD